MLIQCRPKVLFLINDYQQIYWKRFRIAQTKQISTSSKLHNTPSLFLSECCFHVPNPFQREYDTYAPLLPFSIRSYRKSNELAPGVVPSRSPVRNYTRKSETFVFRARGVSPRRKRSPENLGTDPSSKVRFGDIMFEIDEQEYHKHNVTMCPCSTYCASTGI